MASILSGVTIGAPPPARDVSRSLFGIAVATALASVVLREIHEVRLSYDLLSFVWFASWVAGGVSVVASLLDTAKTGRPRSLYFAVVVVAGQLLAFQKEMDDGVASMLAAFLWALLAAVVLMEVRSLLRSSPPSDDLDID